MQIQGEEERWWSVYKSEERDLSDVSILSVQMDRGEEGPHTCTSTCEATGIREGRDRVGSIGSRALSALIRHQTEGCCGIHIHCASIDHRVLQDVLYRVAGILPHITSHSHGR